MNKGLKITGKVALFIVTPTVLLILFFIFTWVYRKYYSKKYTEEAIDLWKNYFNEKDLRIVDLYGKDAVLIGTFAENIKAGTDKIKVYFTDLFKKEGLSVEFEPEALITETKNGNIVSGNYVFRYKENGETKEVPARYSLTVKNILGKSLIINHHSSINP